jgi:hypothetical protein
MIDAFYNGYPLIYSDTGTYLASGFQLETPVDRPITYGLFIKLASFNGYTLWTVIFFQSLILSCLIFMLLKETAGAKSFILNGLLLVLSLCLLTGVSCSSCQLLADIFTPIALLSLLLILIGNLPKIIRIGLYIMYFIAIAMHMAHILLFSLLLIVTYLIKKWLFQQDQKKLIRIRITVMLLLTISASFTMGSAISKSKDVFMMGAMVEQGITKKYLDEYCGYRHYKLCAYKDSLPKTLNAFVWDSASAFYRTGGWSVENRKEFNDIILSTYTKPKYIWLHITTSLNATLKQLVSFNIADGNGKFLEGTLPFERIQKYVPGDLKQYSQSKQNELGLSTANIWNKLYNLVVLFSSLLLLLLVIVKKQKLNGNFIPILVICLICILLSDWDVATFSCVADRFGCKIMWLIPFLLAVGLFKAYSPTLSESKNNS